MLLGRRFILNKILTSQADIKNCHQKFIMLVNTVFNLKN